MNKKTLAIITALLVLSMTLTPLALAKPWEYPKNNEKFQSFHVELTDAASFLSRRGLAPGGLPPT